ncbi:hypothetical protein Avbf_06704 [Armadillidium vulgare]|nr:hypothetical protein Avbf_06704 [Armadillidium vulgare]
MDTVEQNGHSDDKKEKIDEGDEASNDSDDSTSSFKNRIRKIYCIHTQHIQENHQYWVSKIKEDQTPSDHIPTQKNSPVEQTLQPGFQKDSDTFGDRSMTLSLSTDDHQMEPIEEEKTPTLSAAHSFTYGKNEQKL